MPSTNDSSSSKKRKRQRSEDGSTDKDSSLEPSKKVSKRHEATEKPGYFVMTSSSHKSDQDHPEESQNEVSLTAEDKKEISDLLDDIAERKRKKREKREMRRTNPPAPKPLDNAAASSIEYLKQWHESRETWKFKHARESWLLKHYLDRKIITDDIFELLVPYCVSIKGASKERLRKESKALTKKFKKEHENYKEEGKGSGAEAIRYRRAKALRKALKSDE